MIYTLKIDDSNSKAKALLEFLQTLEFVKIDDDTVSTWQKDQLDKALMDHKNESTNYIPWEEAKKDLFKKFKLK